MHTTVQKMRTITCLSIVFLSSLLLIFCPSTPTHATSTWDVQIADVTSEGIVNGNCPIAADSNNNPHIFYTGCYAYNENNRYYDLPTAMYAKWNGSNWKTQIALGTTFDIKLDTNDNPHILYSLSGLVYSKWAGLRATNWVNETITRNRVLFASLALDSEDNPHIAYTDGKSVKYANWNGSNWNIQTIDTYSEIPNSVFLALDSNSTPYILYCSKSSYQDNSTGIEYRSIIVKCAVWKNSSWSIENVLDSYNLGDYGNLVMDSKGYPHFVCAQHHFVSPENTTSLNTILYASWDGTKWATQTVVENVSLIENSWAMTIGLYR